MSDLNIDFEKELNDANKELQVVEQKKNELAYKVQNAVGFTKENQEMLVKEIRDLMDITNEVIEKLRQDLKIGSTATSYIAMAQLANSKNNQIKEFREILKTLFEISIFKTDEEKEKEKIESGEQEIPMTANQLMALIREAQKSNSLDGVKAEFEIVEDPKETKEKADTGNTFATKPKEDK